MRKLFFALTISFCFLNMKCESNDLDLLDSLNLLIGHWSEVEYEDENITFKRKNELPENDYGITFEKNGRLVERTSGWCGTPPLLFTDYTGKWELTENEISITQDHVPNNYVWRILSITETELIVTRALTEREQDFRDLMDLFDEALDLVEGVVCENSEDWVFAPYGSKACGGPQGYIAYPKSIDIEQFLEKIEIYTQAEHDYNVKWSVFSTCDIAPQPKAVVCENGIPVLKF